MLIQISLESRRKHTLRLHRIFEMVINILIHLHTHLNSKDNVVFQ